MDQSSKEISLEQGPVVSESPTGANKPGPSTSFAQSTPKRSLVGMTRVKQPQIDNFISSIQSFKTGGPNEGKITNALLYFIAVDNLPLNSTDKKGLQYLMKSICPHYTMPGRKTITKLLDEKYDCAANILKNKLKEAKSVCLTTDVWTDTMNTRGYLGLTCHYLENDELISIMIGVKELEDRHTSDYLALIIRNLCFDWNIEVDKIVAIVTDNGANIVKAVYDFAGRKKHLPCFAHTLNLVVDKAISETAGFEALITKVKSIVTYFKQSVHASDELRKLQKDNDSDIQKLIQDVSTRWNSTFYMLERFVQLSDIVSTILLQNPKAPSMLTGVELAIIKDVINILRPIENVTTEVSGQHYATCSIIIPMIYYMTKAIESTNNNEPSDLGSEFQAKVLIEIKKRFQHIEKVHILAVSSVLDPRFKKNCFNDPQSCAKALTEISDMLKFEMETTPTSTADVSEYTRISEKCNDIWKFHNEMVAQVEANRPQEGLHIYFKQYMSEPLLDRKSDPIKYWSARKVVWGTLSDIALRYLSVVGTSVPSERLFSLANHTLNESRNRIDPKRLSKLIFLRTLPFKDWPM